MAPHTRLRKDPGRRIDYRRLTQARVGSQRNPVVVPDSPPPPTLRKTRAKHPASGSSRTHNGRISKLRPAKLTKAARVSPRPPARKDCAICADTKLVKYFKKPAKVKVCEHFVNICSPCVGNMLKSKVTNRQLNDATLACPFPQCGHELAFETVKVMACKTLFEE